VTETIVRDSLFIGGKWVPSTGHGVIEVEDPATEQTFATIPEGTAEDIDRAVAAARAAFPGWSATAPDTRADILDKAAIALMERIVDLGALVSREAGTPMPGAVALQGGVAPVLFQLYAGIARTFEWEHNVGERVVTLTEGYGFDEADGSSLVISEPIGVVGAITPWNYPLNLVAYKVAPALAAGCTVVLKPSEVAPLSAFVLAEVLEDAGLPPGVFNVVTGYGDPVGARLAEHPDVDMITFTGSTVAGARVAAAAAATIKRVHLELGGKNAAVVLRGADLKSAVGATVQQLLMNSGQTCLAWSRLVVPAELQDEAVALSIETLQNGYQVGPGDRVSLGPMASAAQQSRVRALIDQAISEGARLVIGGAEQPDETPSGYYIRPTVFADVVSTMTIAQEEVFGPVLSIMPYDTEDDAADIANSTRYGLHGAVFADDEVRARAFARQIRTGQIDINQVCFNPMAPFGGYKQSGNGKELGVEGFQAFLEQKTLQTVASEQ
jgi:aldehyde dehydrogenase (NAD+)